MLKFPSGVSTSFVDFVSNCIKRIPNKRCNVSKLLTHPFIIKGHAYDRNVLFDDISEITKEGPLSAETSSIFRILRQEPNESLRNEIRMLDEVNAFHIKPNRPEKVKFRDIQDFQIMNNGVVSPPQSDKFLFHKKGYSFKNDSDHSNSMKDKDNSDTRCKTHRSKDDKIEQVLIDNRLNMRRKTSFINFESESINR